MSAMRLRRPRAGATLLATLWLCVGCAATGVSKEASEAALAEEAASLEELLTEGDRAFRRGDLDTAQLKFAVAAERDPENVETLYKLGVIHNERGTLIVAAGVLRAALALDPTHQGVKETLGLVALKQERLDEAEKLLTAALETRPDAWQALNALGVIADMRAEHAKARGLFERALEIEPRSAKAANNLGYSHYLAGEDDAAERMFERATRLAPDYVHAWSNLALVHTRNGRRREASAAFEKIVEAHQAANNLGYLGLLRDDDALARSQLERAVALAPSYYETANRNLEALVSNGRGASAPRDRTVPPIAFPPIDVPDGDASGSGGPAGSDADIPVIRVGTVEVDRSARGTTTDVGDARDTLRAHQRFLDFLGFRMERIDGIVGQETREAVRRFQGAQGLQPSGRIDARTAARLRREVVETVQHRLHGLGYDPGEADGILGTKTRDALRAFRSDEGLPESAVFDGTELGPLREATARQSKQLNSHDSVDYSSRG